MVVTGWYATRLWLRTFFGEARTPAAEHPHDPPWLMRTPLLVLAVPSALLGFAGLAPGFARKLAGSAGRVDLVHIGLETLLPLVAAATGVAVAWLWWRRDPAADPAQVLGPARPVFAAAFGFDAVQEALVVRPVMALASVVRRGDESGVDGAVEATGRGTSGLGALLGRAHRTGLPRAATAVLAGAVLFGVVAAILEAIR